MKTTLTLDHLKKLFPSPEGRYGVTGYIPVDFFNEFESQIRIVMHENHLRTVWRGPRTSNPSSTYRKDAHSVVLYVKR